MDTATSALEERKKQAIVEKDVGNSCYKKREFKKALEHYNAAIALDSRNIAFYTNKAAVFFEQGLHDKCRETCLEAISIGREHQADVKLIAKAFTRIGSSFMKEKSFVEATEFFKKSLAENKTNETMEKIAQCEKELKEAERLAYINPDVAFEEKTKGDEAFSLGNFPDAIMHYTEAIKRNPDEAKLYASRASAQMKIKKYDRALQDCEECTVKNQTFVKGYLLKGAALEALKDYDAAMDCYQKSLDLDPNAKQATEAYYRCLDKDYQGRNCHEFVRKRAMADPEVQKILTEPETARMLHKLQEDPKVMHSILNDPYMAEKFRRLAELGLVTVR